MTNVKLYPHLRFLIIPNKLRFLILLKNSLTSENVDTRLKQANLTGKKMMLLIMPDRGISMIN